MAAQKQLAIHPIFVEIFHSNDKCQPPGGARGKVRGSPKSEGSGNHEFMYTTEIFLWISENFDCWWH